MNFLIRVDPSNPRIPRPILRPSQLVTTQLLTPSAASTTAPLPRAGCFRRGRPGRRAAHPARRRSAHSSAAPHNRASPAIASSASASGTSAAPRSGCAATAPGTRGPLCGVVERMQQRQALFAAQDVVARRLARHRRVAPDAEEVVLNLKGQPDLLAEAPQRTIATPAPRRRSAHRSPRWRRSARPSCPGSCADTRRR